MKKYVFASLALLSCYSASAQSSSGQVLSGDFDGSNTITVADVTYMTDIILGKREPVYVTVPSVSTDLQISRQAFVDESGTFPQFRFDEGQYVTLCGFRGDQSNFVSIPVSSIGDDGLSAHSDGGLFSLRQDDTQYMISTGETYFSLVDGVSYGRFEFDRYQWYNCRGKFLQYSSNFSLSQPVSFVDGAASFELYNLSALVRLNLSGLIPGAEMRYIELENDDNLFLRNCYLAVTADGVQLNESERENTNMLRLYTDECTIDEEGKCEVYMAMGAADLSGKEIRIKAFINDVPFTATVSGQRMEMNHCYTYAASDFTMQGNTVSVGDNTVNGGEYIFVPKVSGYYNIGCDAGCDVSAPVSMAGWYQMEADTPYRIYVYGDGNLNIEKKAIDVFKFGTAKSVTAGTYYQLTIPSTGFYHLATANGSNVMSHECYGDYSFPGWPDYTYMESGTNIVYFQNDDNVTITPLASIAVGTANAVEAQTYYTFNIEEEGYYTITTDELNHINVFGDEIDTGGETPQRYVLRPNEREHRIRVQNAGTLTIEMVECPVIELGTATQVYSNHSDNLDNNIYKFVVTERALYQITTPEGYSSDIVYYGENKYQSLDPGTYFIRFYSNNLEPEQITVSISKSEVETLSLDAVNTVRVSTYEQPIYYRFQTGPEWATYYLHPGAGCSFEVSNRVSNRFMDFGENEEYFVRFWSNDPSATTSTFCISKAETVDMHIGEWVEVATDKLYRVRAEEDGDYHFSASNGCHIVTEWGGYFDDQKRWMSAGEERRIYFFSDTEDIATTTALVKKVEYIALPYNEEATVEFDATYYTFGIPESGQYVIYVGDGCSYFVEGEGSSIDWLNEGTYNIHFSNNGNASLTQTTAKVGPLVEMAPVFALGTEVTANTDTWYKLEVTEDDQYVFFTDAAWVVEFKDLYSCDLESSIDLTAGTYYIRFNKQYEEAPSSANVTIGKLFDMAPVIELGTTFLPRENMWYKLVVVEQDAFRIIRTGDWTYDIQNIGNPGDIVILEPNTYLIRFCRGWWSGEEGSVTVSKFSDQEFSLNVETTVTDSEQWYKLSITETGAYKFTISDSWTYEIYGKENPGEIASLTAGNYYVRFYPAYDGAGSSARVQVCSFETESITLGESFEVNDTEQYYTLVLPEDTFYEINVGDGWACQWSPGTTYMYAGAYTLRFYNYDGAYESANVIISKAVLPAITIDEDFEVTEAGKYYILQFGEPDWYRFNVSEGWTYDVMWYGNFGEMCYRGNETFYITFWPEGEGAPATAHVTISKGVDRVALQLGDNETERGKLYTFSSSEPAFYGISTDSNRVEYESADYWTTVNGVQLVYFYESNSSITYMGTGENMSVTKFDELPYSEEATLGEEKHFVYGQLYKIVITEEGGYRIMSNETSGMWWDLRGNNNESYTLSDSGYCRLTPGTYYTVCYNEANITIYKEQ